MKQPIGILLILVMLIMALSPCIGVSGAAEHGSSSILLADDGRDFDHCPDCPSNNSSPSDDCSSCDCACQPTVLSPPFDFSVHRDAGDTAFFETFTFPPDVYLPKFIPPQLV